MWLGWAGLDQTQPTISRPGLQEDSSNTPAPARRPPLESSQLIKNYLILYQGFESPILYRDVVTFKCKKFQKHEQIQAARHRPLMTEHY